MAIYPKNIDESPACVPRTVYHSFPKRLQNAYDKITPDLMQANASQLEKIAHPTDFEWLIRVRLWTFVERHHNANGEGATPRFNLGDFFEGFMAEQAFSVILGVPKKAAWILCPLSSKVYTDRRLLKLATDRMREILSIKIIDEEGNLIVTDRVMSAIAKAAKTVEDRILGRVARSVNVNLPAGHEPPPPRRLTEDEMNSKIKKLEARAKGLPVDVIEAEAEEEVSAH